MKKTLSVFLAFLFLLSAWSVGVSAAAPQEIHVYDLLKHNVDGETNTCYTIEIFFEKQYSLFDDRKQIVFQDEDGRIAAFCVPHTDYNRKFDLYTPDGRFGVTMDPAKLYYLVIPEGTYRTTDGIPNAEYRGEYNGIYLTGTAGRYKAYDLNISNFLAGKVKDGRLYSGKILVNTIFQTLLVGKNSVVLYKIDGNKEILLDKGSITGYKPGQAHVEFNGVKIERYASYKLHVQYGTLCWKETNINDHSEFQLSGKKLLGLSETYPAVDFLIAAFGADSWTLDVYTTVLKVLAFFKLVDKAMVNDVKSYIKARKK